MPHDAIVRQRRVKKGQWLWDTRDVQSGEYMYELMKGNQRLESGRIGVVK